MKTSIIASRGFIPVKEGDMVIIIPKDDPVRQLAHLDSLEPVNQTEFDEITVLFDSVNGTRSNCNVICKPTLKLVKGG